MVSSSQDFYEIDELVRNPKMSQVPETSTETNTPDCSFEEMHLHSTFQKLQNWLVVGLSLHCPYSTTGACLVHQTVWVNCWTQSKLREWSPVIDVQINSWCTFSLHSYLLNSSPDSTGRYKLMLTKSSVLSWGRSVTVRKHKRQWTTRPTQHIIFVDDLKETHRMFHECLMSRFGS